MQKHLRLTRREDFSKVYRQGKSFANHQFVLYYLAKSDLERFRVGIAVSKKIGNAVVRNRLRRIIKEIIRHHEHSIAAQIDFILIARKPVADLSYKDMEKSLMHLLKKSSLLIRKPNERSSKMYQ